MGSFARTLLEKANDESGANPSNNDDELSPNSIRQLMFFHHPRSNPKPIYQDQAHTDNKDANTENISPNNFPTLVHREGSMDRKECTQKTMTSNGFTDSAIATSISSMSVADPCDLSVGSTTSKNNNNNNNNGHLSTVMENSESHHTTSRKQPSKYEVNSDTPNIRQMRTNEGCITIRNSQPQKPSPPLMLKEPSVPLKCVAIVPGQHSQSNQTGQGQCDKGQTRKSVGDSYFNDIKPLTKKMPTKYATLSGTPKGFHLASGYSDVNAVRSAEPRMRTENLARSSSYLDWNLGVESVQGKSFLIIKRLGKGGSGEVFLVRKCY